MSLREATIDRDRRDLVTHEVMDESRLIRFVAAPDGSVAPDLARKLPGRGRWVAADRASVEAADGSADGRGKLLSLAKHMTPPPKVCGVFTADDLSLALGLENAIHAVLLEGGRADRWTFEVERLAGFRPLLPPEWGERPAEDPDKDLNGRGSAP